MAAAALAATLIATTIALPAAASVGVVSIWQAKLGSSGYNGTATISTNSSGTGTLSLSAKRLRPGTSYSVGGYSATCSRPGARFLSLPAQRASSSGVISKKFTLTASQVRALFNVDGPRHLRLGSGSNARCGAFTVLPVTSTMPLGASVLVPPTAYGGAFHVHTVLDFTEFTPDADSYWQPAAGNVIVSVLVDIESYDVRASLSYYRINYTLRDAQGFEYDPTYSTAREPELGSGELTPGQFVRGWVNFEVPEAALAVGFTLVYNPWYGRSMTIRLNSPKAASGSSSPSSSASPSPSASPAALGPEFAAFSVGGTGDQVVFVTKPAGLALANVTTSAGHQGNIIVWTLRAGGSHDELLVNEIGAYDGTVLFDTNSANTVALEVTASGPWNALIKPVSQAPIWDGQGTRGGGGDQVLQFRPAPTGLTVASFTHVGSSNFIVWAYGPGSSRSLLVNEIGNYNGSKALPAGASLLSIRSEGTWSVRLGT